jgi:hypothetical protein
MLHLNNVSRRRPLLSQMSEKDHSVQADLWYLGARSIPMVVPSLDFLGWNGEHYVVVRSASSIELKELPTRRRLDCSKGVDLGSEDAWWLERKDVPIDYELPTLEPQT